MAKGICGIDCGACELNSECNGCAATNGNPFGGGCVIARCCKNKGKDSCSDCPYAGCELKRRLIDEINELDIADMPTVSDFYAIKGVFINLEYTLPSGQNAKFCRDDSIYLANKLPKKFGSGCYGVMADERFLMVAEYNEETNDSNVVVYKKRKESGTSAMVRNRE